MKKAKNALFILFVSSILMFVSACGNDKAEQSSGSK